MSDQVSGIPSYKTAEIKENLEEMSDVEKIKLGICPSCGGSLVFQEGCKACYGCGWGGCE